MRAALDLWRQLPNETEAALSRYHPGRHIREWHRGEMSSRELLSLLSDLPEDSTFRERAERTHRLVEVDGQLRLYSVLAELPPNAVIEAEFIDWTYDRKIAARTALEIALSRADRGGEHPSRDGLDEPLVEALRRRAERKQTQIRDGHRSLVRDAINRGKRRE
ncbi:hypothetical protein NM962_01170 [Mycobacterium sp. SVM_VP21]|nr:hypothetical protein NM962_01170 [Mycobacterium sp. SVM_VP21]